MEICILERMYRFSVDHGVFGGIVIADSIEEAESKVRDRYGDAIKVDLKVWSVINDDYFDFDHPDVIDCY